MKKPISRRGFLHVSAGLAGATASSLVWAAPALSTTGARALSRLRVGMIGMGGQGRFLMQRFQANPHVEVVAISDCYDAHMERAQAKLPHPVPRHRDFRRILDDRDVDAVVIATPDHWHCLMGIMACQAGKDVYVEKPLSLGIDEGRQLVRHARRHDRVVQVGLMQRSGPMYQEVVDIVRGGQLGKITVVKAWNLYNRLPGVKKTKKASMPEGLDWNLWLGPRPARAFDPFLLKGGFRWVWDFGGGNLTDRGTHTMDTIRQAMNVEYPSRVSSVGGKYVFTDENDSRETPDTLNVLYDFGDWTLHYEAREANHRVNWPSGYGFVFFGSRASLFVDRGGYRFYPERNRKEVTGENRTVGTPGRGPVVGIHEMFDPHIQDFVDCIGTRKRPICDVEVGQRSTNISHLGNMAYHLKRTIAWNGVRESCEGDDEAQGLAGRDHREPWSLPRIDE